MLTINSINRYLSANNFYSQTIVPDELFSAFKQKIE